MGTVYKRTPKSKNWSIKYHRNGKAFYESSRSPKKSVAEALLRKREGEIANGKLPGVVYDRIKYTEIRDDLLRDYRNNSLRSIRRVEKSVEHLNGYFENHSVPNITTSEVNKYIEQRLNEGAKNATINRELSALKRALNLGAKETPPKVDRVPYIPMLKENNTRKGFFEHADFIALRDASPDYLKGFITFGYKSGWRVSEISTLTWKQVDLKNGIVRLETGETKNDEGRTIYLDSELQEVFQTQWNNRKLNKKILPYVFVNIRGDNRIKQFNKAWAKACKDAKIGKRLFHDFRRTAVRNMVRAGIPERVAMMISGHKTRSVFERYNIVNDADLKMAAAKQEAYLSSQIVTKSLPPTDIKKKGPAHD